MSDQPASNRVDEFYAAVDDAAPSDQLSFGMPQSGRKLTDAILQKELNEKQCEAAQVKGGPTLILAGAGSGKTRVIIYRIAKLVSDGESPSRIMALTFTNKAASEMKERASALLARGRMDLWISTFHSACLRILRKDADKIGYPKDFAVYDALDQKRLVKNCLKDLGLEEKENPARQIASLISRFKSHMKGPEEAAAELNPVRHENFLRVFSLYQQRLAESRVMDFDDLLGKTVKLLKDHDGVRAYYIDRFRHILVDEFQDTNAVQYQMIKLLTGPEKNICVVGDDDQSIYQWRGATADNLIRFEKDFPGATVVLLEQNYRSTKTILDAANEVVAQNPSRKEKKLWTENSDGEKVVLFTAQDEMDEARYVTETIGQLSRGGQRSLADIAIFYRTNSQSRALEDMLRREGFAYQIYGGQKFYARREVKDILAYFMAAQNPFDSLSLKRVINTPPRGIGAVTVQKLEEAAQQMGVPLVAALDEIDSIDTLNAGAKAKLSAFREIISSIRALAIGKSAPDAINEALAVTGYLNHLAAEKNSEAEGRMENLEELVSAAEDFVERTGDASLLAFLDQAALVADADAVEEGTGSVKLMTVHISKGLEFPVVFVTGLEDNIFPHARSKEDPAQMHEERRLMYVAMTRAQHELHLTHAMTRRIFGVSQANQPSIFLLDIPSHLAIRKGGEKSNPATAKLLFTPQTNSPVYSQAPLQRVAPLKATAKVDKTPDSDGYYVGAKVSHPSFQIGVIRAMDGKGDRSKITIYFPRFGEKKLVKKFAKLTLV